MNNKNLGAFLALIKAGLWENEVRLSSFGEIDYYEIIDIAGLQSVMGLLTAGVEHVQDVNVPQEIVLQLIGLSLQIEQRNLAMNSFVCDLLEKMREEDVYTLLVKGQGVAQCYERPLWRSSGDVDLLLSESNYKKAKELLLSMSTGNKQDEYYSMHLGMNIDTWYVEIHGTLRTGLSGRIDKVVDLVHHNVFCEGNVRSWLNGRTQVFLPGINCDVFFVFTHFIKHFYKEGMNLRQVCDWCRLLWKYKTVINSNELEMWLQKAGLMSEWRAFAALAVDYLGMPVKAMPLYDSSERWRNKAEKIINYILIGYSNKTISDTWAIAKIFPLHTLSFSPAIFLNVNSLKIKERLFGRE